MLAAEDKYARQKRRAERLKIAGLCQNCGGVPTGGKAYCPGCAERVLAKRRTGPRCRVCRVSVPPGSALCDQHAPKLTSPDRKERQNALACERIRAKVANGICRHCSENSAPGSCYCAHHQTKVRDQSRNAYRALRLKVVELYGGECKCCGETETDFLSLDHINNDGAKQRRAGKRSGSALYKLALKERPTDLQLLCYNCNCARGHYGVCPHERARQGIITNTSIRCVFEHQGDRLA